MTWGTNNPEQINDDRNWEVLADPISTPKQGVKWTVEWLLLDYTIESLWSQSIEVQVMPGRWGLIKSIKIWGVEILYQDMYDETLLDTSKSVKGWIPYMFPNAWPLTDEEKSTSWLDLPQHGIARISPWKRITINESQRSIQQEHNISNRWEKDMPISSWLHPYFRVPQGNKSDIKWDFPWGKSIQDQVDIWSNDWTVSFENPTPWQPFSVIIPGLGRLELTASKDYKTFWVWSLPGKDFVCIEPVMWDEWAIANNPVIIKPWESNRNYMRINLFQD